MVLMPNPKHRPHVRGPVDRAVARAMRLAALPGLDWTLSHAARAAFRPALGERLTVSGNPAARDLVRHAFADLGGNAERARAWAKAAASWSMQPPEGVLEAFCRSDVPVLLALLSRAPFA